MRQYSGNPYGDVVQRFRVGDEQWNLAFYNAQQGYVNFKLYSSHEVPRKANYWFGYTRSTKVLCRKRDSKLLAEHRPALYDAVKAYLAEWYP